MNRFGLPFLGYGMGLRSCHFSHILERAPSVGWFEVISENYMDLGGNGLAEIERIRESYPIVLHGVSLSIGTIDPLRSGYLRRLKALAERIKAPWLSDHLCWTGIAHKNTHDLLPVPYAEESLKHIAARVRQVQDALERPFLIENPSAYLEFSGASMPEQEFLARLAEEANCGLLLDVNNVYVTCYNRRSDPKAYLDALPLDRVAQIHLAGHRNKGSHIIDTHDDRVIDDVWRLYKYVREKTGEVSTMVEWDDRIPSFDVVFAESVKAKDLGRIDGPLPSFSPEGEESPCRPPYPYAEQLDVFQQAILDGKSDPRRPPRLWAVSRPDFPAEAQVAAYQEGYRLRLFAIVSEDVPVLRHYLGDERTDALIRAYVEDTPSRHYNVCRYIEDFPAYVARTEDAFASELAELETALSLLFLAPDSDASGPEDFAALAPEAFMESALPLRTALRLFAFRHPADAYYQAVRDGLAPEPPAPEATYLAVRRCGGRIDRIDLEPAEYALLLALSGGAKVGDAVASVMETANLSEEDACARLSAWFAKWMERRLPAKRKAG
jgi:uncharacterized protein (UPF0276 family)